MQRKGITKYIGLTIGILAFISHPVLAATITDIPVCSTLPGGGLTTNCTRDNAKKTLSVNITATTTTLPPLLLPGTLGKIVLSNAQVYNGTMTPEVWELKAGDLLNVKLLNNLTPEADPNLHMTNLHTHGLIVRPSIHFATRDPADKTVTDIGDNIFACTAPQSRVAECAMHGLLTDKMGANMMHYSIKIPTNHPEGLYWYHPHWHGSGNSQVGRGLSGLIWIDRPDESDLYDRKAASGRYMMLKDLTIENVALGQNGANGTGRLSVVSKTPADDLAIPNCVDKHWDENIGMCLSADKKDMRLFTVNGQVYPELKISAAGSEIWKIANTSGSMTYQLSLRRTDAGPKYGNKIPMQIIAKDGVIYGQSCGTATDPRCDTVLLMPASRVTLYVARPADTPASDIVHANLVTEKVNTNADVWPEVSLMNVSFAVLGEHPAPKPHIKVNSRGRDDVDRSIQEESATPDDLKAASRFNTLYGMHAHKKGDALQHHGRKPNSSKKKNQKSLPETKSPDNKIPADPAKESPAPSAPKPDTPVSSGKVPAANPIIAGACPADGSDRLTNKQGRLVVLDINVDDFLIGAGVMDLAQASSGQSIPSVEINKITPLPWLAQTGPQICTHANSNEVWYIANNLSTNNSEMHNFHIHQTKFTVLDVFQPKQADGTTLGFIIDPSTWKGNVQHDTFPVPIGGWIKVQMNFGKTQVGDFVYHCHILEHEDGGMMAHIRVLPE